VIVDSHLHIFPFLDGACGFPSRAAHLEYLQYYMVGHSQPVRRLADNSEVPNGSLQLYDVTALSPAGLADVNFRVEVNGRFVWTQDGEDRYIHFMPPGLQTNEATPEGILAQMAYAGVDVGVLQNAHLYGRLDDDFARAMRQFPGKFVGLAEVEEIRANQSDEIASLVRAVRELGLRALYYANRSFLWDSKRRAFDDPLYEEFWSTVGSLGIPVFWELAGVPPGHEENYLVELDRLAIWQANHPDIRSVLTHGLTPEHILSPPEPVERLFRDERIWIEVLFPIYWGRSHAYPYRELQPVLRELWRRVGVERLCWGSDLPNVERHCTYRQSLDYIYRTAAFLSPAELDRLLGDNLAELFGLTEALSR
jgi:predicted TIM-barrel fold metal-dependent hydrolase